MNQQQLEELEDIRRRLEEFEYKDEYRLLDECDLVMAQHRLRRIVDRNTDSEGLDRVEKAADGFGGIQG